jgi:hypothetical protein
MLRIKAAAGNPVHPRLSNVMGREMMVPIRVGVKASLLTDVLEFFDGQPTRIRSGLLQGQLGSPLEDGTDFFFAVELHGCG